MLTIVVINGPAGPSGRPSVKTTRRCGVDLDQSAVDPYVVEPFRGGAMQPGVDLDDNAALLDLMDLDDRP